MFETLKKNICRPSTAILVIPLILSVCLAAASLYAYFASGETGVNTLTVGEADVSLVEDFVPPKELVRGVNTYKKSVRLTNSGPVSEFVRVYLAFTSSDIRDVSGLSPDGETYYRACLEDTAPIEAADNDEPGIAEGLYIRHLPEGWVYHPEDGTRLGGYYYYTEAIAPGESTEALFDSVRTYFKDAAAIRDYDILIYAESVQDKDRLGVPYTGSSAYETCWADYLKSESITQHPRILGL